MLGLSLSLRSFVVAGTFALAASAAAEPLGPATPAGSTDQPSAGTVQQQAQRGIDVPRRDTIIRRGETVTERERPEVDALGGHVGNFFIFPRVRLTEQYNDNIFATDTGEQSDFITLIAPRVRVVSDFPRHALALDAGAEIGRYLDNTDEDFEDYDFGAEGRLDVTRRTRVRGEAGFENRHVDRSSPDEAGGVEPTDYDVITFGGEVLQDFNRLGVTLGALFEQFDFDDVATGLGGTINNDDRDRDEVETYLRLGYEIVPEYEAFVRGAYNFRNYDSALDDNGVNRDSDGFEVVGGVRIDFTGVTFGDFFAGYRQQDYDDPALDTVSGPVVGADVTWNVTPLTTIVGSVSREIRESTTTDGMGNTSSGRFFTTVALSADHELLRNLLIGADLSYSNDDFDGIDRTDNIYRAGINALYMMNRYVQVGGGYTFRMRDSDFSSADFTENVVSVSLQLQY